jgi:tetratricopeptide (TPR) repeat protein
LFLSRQGNDLSIERGSLLFQTGRHELAEQEFRAALVQEPNNALAHAMVALCLVEQKKYAEATTEAQQAIGLRPDWDVGYSALAAIFSARERLKDAALMAQRAIELDPFDPQHHALLAGIRIKQRQWPAALVEADVGLAIDPQHASCVNYRGIALVNLGRREEASQTIGGALQRNPHNATTHANQGWALLHSGDHKAALEHFREALRINPESQWARAGIVEALKARNIIYRVMLRYFLFMSRMSRQVQWGIVVGGYLAYQLLHQVSQSHPQLSPWVTPILIAYNVFAVMTWLSGPLFNLMLRIDKFGRYALSGDQRACSNWVGVCLLIVIGVAAMWFMHHDLIFLLGAALVAIMAIPISAVFRCDEGWPRWTMTGYSMILVLLLTGVFILMLGGQFDIGLTLLKTYVVAVVAAQFVANGLAMASVKK